MPLRRVALFGVRFWVYSGNELWVDMRPIWSVSDYGDFGCPRSLEGANQPRFTPVRSSNREYGHVIQCSYLGIVRIRTPPNADPGRIGCYDRDNHRVVRFLPLW